MSITNVMLVLQVLNYSRQYDAIIANITTANSISGHIKPDIDTEMWRIVAGKIEFADGKQYEIINDVNTKLRQMMAQHRLAACQDQAGGNPEDHADADLRGESDGATDRKRQHDSRK